MSFIFLDQQGEKEALLIARKTLENYFINQKIIEIKVKNQKLLEKGPGVFVTLKKQENLRGCIGVFQSNKPLYQTIQEMTLASAFEDPRFFPLKKEELKEIKIEISILTTPKKISDWRKIKLGEEGVIVEKEFKKGVYLPQVAKETGWSLEEFLSSLCFEKAGLSPNCYQDPAVNLYTFKVQEISE